MCVRAQMDTTATTTATTTIQDEEGHEEEETRGLDFIEDEPLVSKGLSATLAFMSKRGGYDLDSMSGSAKDVKGARKVQAEVRTLHTPIRCAFRVCLPGGLSFLDFLHVAVCVSGRCCRSYLRSRAIASHH